MILSFGCPTSLKICWCFSVSFSIQYKIGIMLMSCLGGTKYVALYILPSLESWEGMSKDSLRQYVDL